MPEPMLCIKLDEITNGSIPCTTVKCRLDSRFESRTSSSLNWSLDGDLCPLFERWSLDLDWAPSISSLILFTVCIFPSHNSTGARLKPGTILINLTHSESQNACNPSCLLTIQKIMETLGFDSYFYFSKWVVRNRTREKANWKEKSLTHG